MGSPGSGKSYFIIQHVIKQHIQKGFSMFVYDFKFDDLTKHAYNQYLKYVNSYPVKPKFYIIDFDKIFNRCNPIHPATMADITDAAESSRTIMILLIRSQNQFYLYYDQSFEKQISGAWFVYG